MWIFLQGVNFAHLLLGAVRRAEKGGPCTLHAEPECSPLLTCLLPRSGSSGGRKVSFKLSSSFWMENDLHLFMLSALPLIKNPVIVSSCQHTCSISCSFLNFSWLPCIIKQQHQNKPNQALLHCVSVVSHFFAMCLACHCFAALHRW